MEDIKDNIRYLLFEKLEDLQRRPQTLKKFFTFSISDIEQDYEGCIEVMEDYIDSHRDKIQDFEFETWIDEVSMTPVLMLKMELVPSLGENLSNNRILNKLLPSTTESEILREELSNIFANFSYELNNEENRRSLLDKIKYKTMIFDIEDRTTDQDIDNGNVNFIITQGGKEMTLNEYLKEISKEGRFESDK